MRQNIYIPNTAINTALTNDIPISNLYKRVRELGWSIERACTQPVKRNGKTQWKEWEELATEHGINYFTFYNRTKYQRMSPRDAATTPIKGDY